MLWDAVRELGRALKWCASPSAMRWFLLLGFMAMSFLGTFLGLRDLIATGSEERVDPRLLVPVGFAVLLMTVAMVYTLSKARQRIAPAYRIAALLFYLFSVVWSAGFGFAFWWGFLAARSATNDEFKFVSEEYTTALANREAWLAARLGNSIGLGWLQETASRKMRDEERGGSCGVPSDVGRGPLWLARRRVTCDIASCEADEYQGRILPAEEGMAPRMTRTLTDLQSDISTLRSDINTTRDTLSATRDVDVRTAALDAFNETLLLQTQELNASLSHQTAEYAEELSRAATPLDVPPDPTATICSDPELASDIQRVAEDLRGWEDIAPPTVQSSEGTESTQAALVRLWDTIIPGGGGGGLVTRDWIALMAAIIIDAGVFLFTFLVRPAPFSGAMGGNHPPETVRRRLLDQIRRLKGMSELLSLKFESGGRFFLAYPTEDWKWGPAEEDTEARMSRLIDMHLMLAAADLVRSYTIVSGWVWPWRSVTHKARGALRRVGWIEKARGASGITSRLRAPARVDVFRINTVELDALTALDAEHIGSDWKREEKPRPRDVFASREREKKPRDKSKRELPAEAVNLMRRISDLDSEIGRLEPTLGPNAPEILDLSSEIARLAYQLGDYNIELLGREGDELDRDVHYEVDAVYTDRVRRHVIVKVVRHGFRRVDISQLPFLPSSSAVIEPARVVVSLGRDLGPRSDGHGDWRASGEETAQHWANEERASSRGGLGSEHEEYRDTPPDRGQADRGRAQEQDAPRGPEFRETSEPPYEESSLYQRMFGRTHPDD